MLLVLNNTIQEISVLLQVFGKDDSEDCMSRIERLKILEDT